MLYSISQNYSLRSQAFKEIYSSSKSTVEKTEKVIFARLKALPASIKAGVVTGLYTMAAVSYTVLGLSLIPGVKKLLASPPLAEKYSQAVMGNLSYAIVVAPVWEEIVFRGIIQNSVEWVASEALPDMNIKILSFKEQKLSFVVALVATSVLFGAMHLGSGKGILHVVAATIYGIGFGILSKSHGLEASITAHMTVNGMACASLLLRNLLLSR